MAERANLIVGDELVALVEDEVLPPTGIGVDQFWEGLAAIIADLGPRNAELLETRQTMQAAIDRWHREHGVGDPAEYRSFLESIGYLVPEGPAFEIHTKSIDREIAEVAGPQLVVPVTNARYAINAVNAR